MSATQTQVKPRSERVSNLGKSLILIKPDAVQRGLIGQIIARFEARGIAVVGLKMLNMTDAIAAKHYEPHVGRPFYPGLVQYMTSGPIVAIALEGADIITVTRKMMGATKPTEAEPGTIRGDFAQRIDFNIIHGSDSDENATRELAIFFKPEELLSHDPGFSHWV